MDIDEPVLWSMRQQWLEAISADKCCVVVAVDFITTFNSVSWDWIRHILANLGGPGYLPHLIESYLLQRLVWYTSDDESKEYIATTGVSCGSVLSPCCGTSRTTEAQLSYVRGATLIIFADYLALFVVAKHPENLQEELYEIILPSNHDYEWLTLIYRTKRWRWSLLPIAEKIIRLIFEVTITRSSH